jgi:ABC-2 type transport system ATP-binding protein
MTATTSDGATIEIRAHQALRRFRRRRRPVVRRRPGRITGFLGPNGAGKTTTLRMISDLVRPTAARPRSTDGRTPTSDQPLRTVGAALEATNFHPGRRARPPARAGRRRPASRQRASTSCSSSPASPPRHASARVSTAWACGSGSAWPPRSSATRRSSPRRAGQRSGPRGHPLAARLPAPPQRRGQDHPGLQPPAPGGAADRRRRRHHQQRPAGPLRHDRRALTGRRGLVRTSDPDRLAGALRVADVEAEPIAADDPTAVIAVTDDLRLVGDVALGPGCRSGSSTTVQADLESVFFELTEGTNRNLGATADASSPAPTEGADR